MRRERGSATVVLMLGLIVTSVMFAVAWGIGRVAVARAHVSGVADLAALAAAESGECSTARPVAQANGARLRECTNDGLDVILTVESGIQILPGRRVMLAASARAGPA